MKYYLIAGEASGDLHGAGLVAQLRQLDKAADIRAWGGEKMEAAGAELVMHYRDLAYMGFIEVAKNIGTILKNLAFCKKDIRSFGPDALVLIDYPGFNMRIARWARKNGIPVMYYIAPQVWAWNVKRVYQLKRDVSRLFVILPFEKEFFARYGMDVHYVGHPLKKVIDEYRATHPKTGHDKKVVALLPGSRKQEIMLMLPAFVRAASQHPEYQFRIACAPAIDRSFYVKLIPPGTQNVDLNEGDTYALLNEATAAIATSGTATLETALFSVPQVVCYKGNPISFQLARRLVRVPYISLVNLIAGKEVVKELIQSDLNPRNLDRELVKILNGSARKVQMAEYEQIHGMLSHHGSPPEAVAQQMIHYLRPG